MAELFEDVENIENPDKVEEDVLVLESSFETDDDVVEVPYNNSSRTVSEEEEQDIICQLLKTPFAKRTLEQKKEVISNGRPIPSFFDGQSRMKRRNHQHCLSRDTFFAHKWLVFSEARARVYCWSCILFPVVPSDWNQSGFHFNIQDKMCVIHSKSKIHISSEIKLNRFKSQYLSQERSLTDQSPNSYFSILQNREIFKRLLDGLALHCTLPGKLELYDYLFQQNIELKIYWEKLKEDTNRLAKITKGLALSVKTILQRRIHHEINESRFFSLIVNDHPGGLISVIIRFIDADGKIRERSLGLCPFKEKTIDCLYDILNSFLRRYFHYKLVAYSFSGGCLNIDQILPMNDLMKNSCPRSVFVNCSYQSICDTIAEGCYNIPETRIFFSALKTFPRFIISTVKISLNDTLAGNLNEESDFKTTIGFILEKRSALVKFFQELEGLHHDTMNLSYFYLALLKEENFICLLISFSLIFSTLDSIEMCELNSKEPLISNSREEQAIIEIHVKHTEERLNLMRSNDGIEVFFSALADFEIQPDENQVQLFKDLIANAISHIDARFQSSSILKIFKLVDSRYFSDYSYRHLGFPTDLFTKLKQIYGVLFDFCRLKNELEVLYDDPCFRKCSLTELSEVIKSGSLQYTLTETTKLLVLLRTIPPAYGSIEDGTPSKSLIQKNIKEFVATELPQDLNLIGTNKDLLKEMKESFDWYTQAMNEFSRSEYNDFLKVF